MCANANQKKTHILMMQADGRGRTETNTTTTTRRMHTYASSSTPLHYTMVSKNNGTHNGDQQKMDIKKTKYRKKLL